LEKVKEAIGQKGLNRLVIGGCESRVMLKKFERELEPLGLEEGQIDMVNLRDHVAKPHPGEPAVLAVKGAKLIKASLAGLQALEPAPKVRVEFKGPVMVLGGGIASYGAAQELLRQQIETIIVVPTEDGEEEIRRIHERYPGERHYYDRLGRVIREVQESPLVQRITGVELEKVMGRLGDYTVTFSSGDQQTPQVFQVGAIIAALDGEMLHQGSDFGHDGVRVLCQTEMEEFLITHQPPAHRVVFWINDLETARPYAQLSTKTAWNMACFIREKSVQSQVSILYNNRMPLPLSTSERVKARTLGIAWIPYDGSIRPTVQAGYITYSRLDDQIEHELPWEQLVLSPRRSVGLHATKIAKILGEEVVEGEFLEMYPQMVRPDQVGLDERVLIAGSARQPCDLREALRQGHRAAGKIAELVHKARAGELFAPRNVCTVDQSRCTGCGLCKEICGCGGIQPVEGVGGNIPRSVDPMVCTGDGTCAAACPHLALTLQNNTTAQHEARVTALAQRLAENEVLGFGCFWSGTAAADHAGLRGLTYSQRFHLLPIRCIGQLDPSVMARAFLEGANGLLLIGCRPEECHHSYGLDHTWNRILLIKKLLSLCGLERERIALAHSDLNKPAQFVRTVESFLATVDRLGPIARDTKTLDRLKALYDTVHNARVRWVLGVSLRRPWETTYPADQREALAYDETLTDVLTEEFVRTRITNLLHYHEGFLRLDEITKALDVEKQRALNCLKEMADEGLLSRIFKDRIPYYSMP
jgi:coenzyme F420-reducing hydrogenase delta subunit/ferredoxin